ncbi:hypothetical protein KCP76_11405 [Salmonella enterica subsp. enterica serovar Weltevreden]|nr:hypothetical protein KCP76_11405 [Salmonella enterica subsp. enterica serovar Weltevreden]
MRAQASGYQVIDDDSTIASRIRRQPLFGLICLELARYCTAAAEPALLR